MTAYTYGPWTPHTSDECPVEADTLVQIWIDGYVKFTAETIRAIPAAQFVWHDRHKDPIRFYRVCTPVEEVWQVETGWANSYADSLGLVVGIKPHPDDAFRISWPYTVNDGKRVPDFTRQPKWEPLK